ncbi:uncharacterized protein LOC121179816 [Toxotes jaculatrix]|uniref:uncharacterized protein LOC121179816 n=1 Tax=Toxotes jaculatrix TaxID=941984 RepID=UPI001B3AD6DD|nr:uncharacterized protein LOC121179816 [Toxotes jaculatrix]
MKTLCFAVVLLSLTSVCQPASLACDSLLKKEDKSPDLSGRWYLVAMSSDMCVIPLISAFIWPSVAVDVTSKDTPNVYEGKYSVKMYGLCTTEPEPFFYGNNSIFDVDSNNAPTGEPDVMLHSSCPDCYVIKGDDVVETLMLFSRRQTVTAAELKEFETQADCLGWYKPQLLSTDHDFENCSSLDDDSDLDTSGLSQKFLKRLKNTYSVPLNCLAGRFFYYYHSASEWAKQTWASL